MLTKVVFFLFRLYICFHILNLTSVYGRSEMYMRTMCTDGGKRNICIFRVLGGGAVTL